MAAAQRLPYAIFLPIWITNECCLIGIQFCSSLKIFNNFKINARDSRYSEIISVVVCGMCVDGCKTLAAIVVMSPAIVPFLGLEGDTFSHHFEEGGVFAFIAHFFAIFKGNAILGFLAFAFIHAFVDTCQSVVTTYTMNIGAALGCKPKAETKRGWRDARSWFTFAAVAIVSFVVRLMIWTQSCTALTTSLGAKTTFLVVCATVVPAWIAAWV